MNTTAANQSEDGRATSNILPCAHCGSTKVGLTLFDEDHSRDFVMCNDCGVFMERCYCECDPVEAWNRRSIDAFRTYLVGRRNASPLDPNIVAHVFGDYVGSVPPSERMRIAEAFFALAQDALKAPADAGGTADVSDQESTTNEKSAAENVVALAASDFQKLFDKYGPGGFGDLDPDSMSEEAKMSIMHDDVYWDTRHLVALSRAIITASLQLPADHTLPTPCMIPLSLPSKLSEGYNSLPSDYIAGYNAALADVRSHRDPNAQHDDPTGPNHPGHHDGFTCEVVVRKLVDLVDENTRLNNIVATLRRGGGGAGSGG